MFVAPGSWSTYCRDLGTVRSTSTGFTAIACNPRRTRSTVDGISRGTYAASSGSTCRGSTEMSRIASRISAPETPSIAAWWIFE
jgi:hypothetical protein